MVSSQNPTGVTDVSPDVSRNDRGMLDDRTVAVSRSAYAYSLEAPKYTSFWGSVIAGTLLAAGILVMSYALMFGCGVGVYRSGTVSLGWGAAIWIIITACIAYFFGGMFASCLSASGPESGAFRGLSVWGLSIPLGMVVASIVAMAAGTAYGTPTLPDVHQAVLQTASNANAPNLSYQGGLWVPFGGAWTVFLSLILGLFCAWIGGTMGREMLVRTESRVAS